MPKKSKQLNEINQKMSAPEFDKKSKIMSDDKNTENRSNTMLNARPVKEIVKEIVRFKSPSLTKETIEKIRKEFTEFTEAKEKNPDFKLAKPKIVDIHAEDYCENKKSNLDKNGFGVSFDKDGISVHTKINGKDETLTVDAMKLIMQDKINEKMHPANNYPEKYKNEMIWLNPELIDNAKETEEKNHTKSLMFTDEQFDKLSKDEQDAVRQIELEAIQEYCDKQNEQKNRDAFAKSPDILPYNVYKKCGIDMPTSIWEEHIDRIISDPNTPIKEDPIHMGPPENMPWIPNLPINPHINPPMTVSKVEIVDIYAEDYCKDKESNLDKNGFGVDFNEDGITVHTEIDGENKTLTIDAMQRKLQTEINEKTKTPNEKVKEANPHTKSLTFTDEQFDKLSKDEQEAVKQIELEAIYRYCEKNNEKVHDIYKQCGIDAPKEIQALENATPIYPIDLEPESKPIPMFSKGEKKTPEGIYLKSENTTREIMSFDTPENDDTGYDL